ncbi:MULTISPECIES: DUF3954 domain-containing protein [Bacillus]|uniref:Phage protein n=1 Tax=Bacillus cereus TIAC219 TaxID=718222 RepID=A0ABC9STU8_BACCE|nr:MULTISPECIES: DUF3954 domain-containing protein [Bacillus]EJP84667.1 hypothetical protein IC1_05195 [Bacillus cereus VD022]EOQ59350.1 hypothetical protein IAY_05096 [Bacillus cereus TIAC219]MBG9749716.1 phage protein [Bacillus thuringiensis]MBG9776600.1 phage protein [Bacillus thuringiensis]MBG9924339.1 phage protein [Bacillus thuringiensis]
MKKEIDVTSNKVYVVTDGKVLSFNPPESGYGEQVVIWVNGKAGHVKTTSNEMIK